MYLAYDIRGIQRYIFAVPKLKSIVGGSLLIDDFDRKIVPQTAQKVNWKVVFSGGGRGLLKSPVSVSEADVKSFGSLLIELAHERGLDLRLGTGEESDGMPRAESLFPFQPPLLGEGKCYPCALSGLWPVRGKNETHEIIKMREERSRRQRIDTETGAIETIDDLLLELESELHDLLPRVDGQVAALDFFRNVTPDAAEPEEWHEARISARSLGNRNRWAVICMDGNDMGSQIRHAIQSLGGLETEKCRAREKWFSSFSQSLARCTRESFVEALTVTVQSWFEAEKDNLERYVWKAEDGAEYPTLILPFRPLILGGDDVTLLCRTDCAMEFVKNMSAKFNAKSKAIAKTAEKEQNLPCSLWPATGNELTISAGVLFCKTTFPLFSAMEYAESLLSNAKASFRMKTAGSSTPTPAAVDWEAISETLVDSPAERRRREMFFLDGDLDNVEIRLTRKPYLMEELEKMGVYGNVNGSLISQLEKKPGTLRSELLPGLRQPWSQRVIFLASIGKHHSEIRKNLWEKKDGTLGCWWEMVKESSRNVRQTQVIDALSLIDEMNALKQKTVKNAD